MRVRHAQSTGRIEQHMTAMIDVVFQLLVFFVMSLRITTLENEFHVYMPVGQVPLDPIVVPHAPPLRLRLAADQDGELASVALYQRPFPPGDWSALQSHLVQLAGSDAGPDSVREAFQVELDCDEHLRYDHTVQAIDAVSGYRTPSGEIVPLVEKVKFAR